MKKIKTLAALGLSVAMLVGVTACNDGEVGGFSDYYTFDTSAIASELLYGSEMKIDPVVKNLGVVVDANYNVTVTHDGKDVTSSVYDKETKTFAPAEQSDAIGTYTFNLTIVDDEGKNVLDENGKPFSTGFNVDYCIMNFVPKANAGAGVTVNNDDPLSPVISFDDTYATGTNLKDSGQYRVTGVTFADDYEIVYRVKANAISDHEETRFFFGVDRTDENKRDDNIALNINDGRLSSWFFQDNGQASGADWTGTGWVHTTKSVEKDLLDGTTHLIGFTRIVSSTGNAYYVITWDGDYFTTLNVKGNYTDTVGGVWVESINVEGSIEVASYRNLAKDTSAPAVVLNYDDVGAGSEINLIDGIIVMDEIYNVTSNIAWSVIDPEGEAVAVKDGKVGIEKGGIYTVGVTVTDLKGNSTSTSTKFNVYSNFTVDVGLNRFYKAGSEITANVTYSADDAAMVAATEAKLIKGNTEVANAVTGNATDGFKFTPADAGIYILRVNTVTAGKAISKDFEFTVSGSAATAIDMSRNTAEARTGVSMIVYGSGAESIKIYQGDILTDATDVTASVIGTHTTTTCAEGQNLSYTYFTPVETGTYYVVGEKGVGDAKALCASKVTVKDDVIWVYDDEKLDIGNGNLDKVIYGNNEIIFKDNGSESYNTSKVVYDNLAQKGYQGNMTIEFKLTDLKFHANNKKLFLTLGMTGEGGWTWNDICVEGSKNDDLWGYCTNIFGYGWVEYQWRSIWQTPVTNEFIPDPNPETGETYEFRQGSEYGSLYAAGTHTYRIEIRETEAGKCTVYFYIDGRPEATHRNLTYTSNQLGCLVIYADTMSGVVSDIKIINED